MKILIIQKDKNYRIPKRFLERALSFYESKITKLNSNKELVLVFVTAKEMKKINHQFRGKNKVTDVLSFSPSEKSSFGELIFCSQQIQLQAKLNSWSYQKELSYMLLHGILHLLGYEHEGDEKKAKKMFRLQDSIFEEFS